MNEQEKEQLRKEYETALLVKGVSNLSGIVHGLSQAMKLISLEAKEQGRGTEYVNNHPIVRVYLEQMKSLCTADYAASHRSCKERSRKSLEPKK
jgi:hypothetical protein